MGAARLREGRKKAGMTQAEAAARLGVSQAYLSLLEGGHRRVPQALARKAAGVFRLPPTDLPVMRSLEKVPRVPAHELASELAGLGYPGFAYMGSRKKRNPAEVLLAALGQRDLESRLVEALPWLVLRYPDLNWDWLMAMAKQNEVQNRLGFVTSLARRLAEASDSERSKAQMLSRREVALDRARLAREDTLCKESLTDAERFWLREQRPPEAARWNLLTDLTPDHLAHVIAAT